jgi:hypothetical protein
VLGDLDGLHAGTETHSSVGLSDTASHTTADTGIRGINRGVNAVAIRQTTNWGSRFGLSRLAESAIPSLR